MHSEKVYTLTRDILFTILGRSTLGSQKIGELLLIARYNLFESSETEEKRALLNYLLQNYVVDGKKPMFTLRSPFDSIHSVATQPIGLRTDEAIRTWEGLSVSHVMFLN